MRTTTDTYRPARAIMTAGELDAHKITTEGRDYRLSDDGYDDMDVAARTGWLAVSGWGHDGWDLGDWPYVVVSVRNMGGDRVPDHAQGYQLRITVEGDSTVYRFDSLADREAAIDYLFVWYGLGHDYESWTDEGLTSDKRSALDAGTLRVPVRFRGPFSWARSES